MPFNPSNISWYSRHDYSGHPIILAQLFHSSTDCKHLMDLSTFLFNNGKVIMKKFDLPLSLQPPP